jgi:hypothetical protein
VIEKFLATGIRTAVIHTSLNERALPIFSNRNIPHLGPSSVRDSGITSESTLAGSDTGTTVTWLTL